MMRTHRPARRSVLRVLLGGVTAVCAGGASLSAPSAAAAREWMKVASRHDLRAVAQALTDESAVKAMIARRDVCVPATPAEFIARRRADFSAGRVVKIDGWQLAHAEVCLLLALAEITPVTNAP